MRILDIESLGESWDQEHSDDLAAVVKHISSMSSEIKDMKIEVTKEAVKLVKADKRKRLTAADIIAASRKM